jgi:hypothetical protein
VVTNNLKPDLPKLPERCRYKRMVLNEKDHHAFFVSPTDLGMLHLMKPLDRCKAMLLCGRGVEPEGFMQCSVARTLLQAQGKDPAPYIFDEPVTEPDIDICKHCPLVLGTRMNKGLTWRVAAGEIECPTESFSALRKTYAIHESADRHIRRAEELGSCTIKKCDSPVTQVVSIPEGWKGRVPIGSGEQGEQCD